MSKIPSEPEFNFLNEKLFTKTGITGKDVDISLKDLSKVRGKGLGKIATNYNQLKLLLTKGTVIKESDIEKFVKGLKPNELEKINKSFSDVQTKKINLTVPEKTKTLANREERKVAKLHVKDTKLTVKAAQAFARVLSDNSGLIPRKNFENMSGEDKLQDAQRIQKAMKSPKEVAVRLKAALFVEENIENILKSTLFDLRSRPGFQEASDSPGKDFMNFIKDKPELQGDLKKAVQAFQNHIRQGNIDTKALKNYSKNPTYFRYVSLEEASKISVIEDKNFYKTQNEDPLETMKTIQNRNNLRDELQAKTVTPDRLFSLINNPTTRPYLENVYSNKKNDISFQFYVKAGEYEQIKKQLEKSNGFNLKLDKKLSSVEKELRHLITGGDLNLEPHRQKILEMPLNEQVEFIKHHLSTLEASAYSMDIQKVLLSGEKLPVQRDEAKYQSKGGKETMEKLGKVGDRDSVLKFKTREGNEKQFTTDEDFENLFK